MPFVRQAFSGHSYVAWLVQTVASGQVAVTIDWRSHRFISFDGKMITNAFDGNDLNGRVRFKHIAEFGDVHVEVA